MNFIILLILSVSGPAFAQKPEERNFQLYTTRDGLSNNRVTDITQDRRGYMWIATREGLNRFDGSYFQNFFADNNPNSLPRDELIRLYWLDNDQMAATTIGLHIRNTRTLEAKNIIIPAGPLKFDYKVNSVEDILSDGKGNLFILTRSGFYQYDRNYKLSFRYDYYDSTRQGEVFQFGRRMVWMHDTVLLSTDDGLYIFNPSKNDIHRVSQTDDLFIQQVAKPGERFWFMRGDQTSFVTQAEGASHLFYFDLVKRQKIEIRAPFNSSEKFDWRSRWFKLNDSTSIINSSQKGFYLVRFDQLKNCFEIQPQLYFKDFFCTSFYVDKDQRLWIATNKGLFAERKLSHLIETLSVPPQLNPFNKDLYCSSISAAKDKLFVGSNTGILVFQRESLQPITRIPLDDPGGSYIYSSVLLNEDTLLVSSTGLYWINTRNLHFGKYDLPAFDESPEVLALLKEREGGIFVTLNSPFKFLYRKNASSGFRLMDFSKNRFFGILTAHHISSDPDGNIWFGGNGYSRYNPRSQEFDLLLDSFPVLKMARKEVSCPIFVNHRMYFGIPENGLISYDSRSKQFKQYTRENGLPNNTVEAEYGFRDKIWLATDNGIASFDTLTGSISAFGLRDNMPAEPFTGRSFYYDSLTHYLYASFNNTIVRFNPAKLVRNSQPPVFMIESVTVAGKRIYFQPSEKIILSPKENSLVVNIAAVNYEDASQQQFAYRLADEDNEEWQALGSQRSIILTAVSPGNHKLEVKMFVKNKSWPDQTRELEFYIKPPFWKTPLFISLLGIIVLTALIIIYRSRIRSVRQKANIDKQLAEMEIKGLHAQMNPHFIFNSLNSIKEMILENERQNASRYLSKFAQLIRTSLEQSRQAFISVKQCVDHLQQYLEMEKIRFGGFSYTIEVAEGFSTEETQIAPMLVQPLVENAIWHGLKRKDGEKKLSIRFYKSGAKLFCEINDNGVGLKENKNETSLFRHRSLGIQNVRERLAILNEKYHMHCSLTLTNKSDIPGLAETGTIALLELTT